MKQHPWIALAGLTCLYSFLFYQQNAGINFLVFTLAAVTTFWFLKGTSTFVYNQLLYSSGSILSAIIIVLYPTDLALFTNLLSLVLLSASFSNYKSSFITKLLNGIYSIGGSIIFIPFHIKKKWVASEISNTRELFLRKIIYVAVFILCFIFLLIYKNINPLFEKYTEGINKLLDFDLFMFTIGGALLIYGLIYHRFIPLLNPWEEKQEREVDEIKSYSTDKTKAFTLLFIFLNIMLVLINVMDINYLYFGRGLPEGITHKQFVHNGVGMLVFSIVLGTSIILYLFKKNYKLSKLLRSLALLWLIQNLIMVFSTSIRNTIYIHEALLTYKRIGVYYWLLLTAAGLLLTIIKVEKNLPAWYLAKTHSIFTYLLLLGSCVIEWDKFISDYNLSHINDIAALDKRYLMSLSENNMKQLYLLKYHPKFEIDSVYHYNYSNNNDNKKYLDSKLIYFLNKMENSDWQSFDMRSNSVLEDIRELNQKSAFDTLNLQYTYYPSLKNIEILSNLKVLKLPNYFYFNDERIEIINQLERLEVLRTSFNIADTNEFRKFKHIKTLIINDTYTKKDSLFITKLKMPYRVVIER
jgi:hypothetical protein